MVLPKDSVIPKSYGILNQYECTVMPLNMSVPSCPCVPPQKDASKMLDIAFSFSLFSAMHTSGEGVEPTGTDAK